MVDLENWFYLFRFFESRKALRFYGGQKGVRSGSPIFSLLTIVLWLIVFGVANIVVTANSLTLVFQDISEVSNVKIAFFIGNIGLNIISLVILLISVFYGIENIIFIQFLIMMSSAIVVLSLRSQSTENIDEASLQLAILIVTYITTSLLADVLLYFLWVGFLLGPLFRWMKHSDDTYASSVFPYIQIVAFGLLVLLIIPLWIPVLASYFVVLLLQVFGVRIVNRSVLEFLILDRGSYETFRCVAVEETAPGIFRLDFDYRLKEIVTWRFWHFNRQPTSRFTYEGQLNDRGNPHGQGKWADIDYGGEILSGFWSNGRPTAPFRSQEQRPYGGTFSANPLLFVNHGALHRVGFSTIFRGPDYGIASVECGRSGAFYAGFPEARLQLLPNFERMLTNVMAGKPLLRMHVVIYISGFNNSCEGACKMFGQMLALSNYPPQFLPVVFAWPCGNIPNFFSAKEVCESQRMRQEFNSLVNHLWASGHVESIDIVAHSQGCRFLTHSFAQPEMQSLGVRHLVFISPEADLEDFENNGESILHNIRGFVTLYAHPRDTALFWAQLFNTMFARSGTFKKSLGRHFQPILGKASGEALDMDIIDTSYLASNVEELHHSFFYLSREMLWDIQALLVDGRRAEDRPLLIQRGESSRCYHFCSVPPSITTIF